MKGSGFKLDTNLSEHANLNRLAKHYHGKWCKLAMIPNDELTEIQITQKVVLKQMISDLSLLTGYVYVKQ